MKKGFAALTMVYTFFTIFIIMMITVLMINTYKKNFLDKLKEDAKLELKNYHIEEKIQEEM